MLLFVIAALTIFHFALPRGTGDVAARGLLWSALVFTALLGLTRAFVAEREQGMFDALVLAPCDRSAIWLGKALAVLAFLVAAEVVALPAFAAFFHGLDGRTVAAVALADLGIAHVGTLFGAMAVAGRARELLLPLLFLPMAIPIVVGGVGGYLWFLALYDAIFALLAGRRSSTSSPKPRPDYDSPREAAGPRRRSAFGARGRADLLLCADRPRPGPLAAHLLLPRPARPHVVRLLRLGRLEGAPPPAHARRARRPRELRRDPPGRDLRRADAAHRLDLGAAPRGACGGRGARTSSCSSSCSSSSTARTSCCASRSSRAGAGEHERGLRTLRRRADPGVVPRDPALEALHPPGRLHSHGRR